MGVPQMVFLRSCALNESRKAQIVGLDIHLGVEGEVAELEVAVGGGGGYWY